MKKLSLQSAIYLKCLYKLPQNQNKENNCLALFVFVVPEKSQRLVHAMQACKHPALWSSLKQTLDARLVKLRFPTGVWGGWVSCMSWFSTLLFPSCWSLFFRFLGAWFLTARTWGFTNEGEAQKESLKKKKIQFSGHLYNFTTIVTTCARLTRHINYSIQECGETQQLHRRTRKWTGFHLSPATPDGNPRLWWTFGFRHATSCSKSWVAGWLFPQKLIASQVFLQLYNSKEKG